MLTQYQTETNRYLQNPGTSAALLYPTDAITSFINRARRQLAGEAECIRNFASIPLVIGQRSYDFVDITLGSPSTGIAGIFNVRQVLVVAGDGALWLQPRSFEWMTIYNLNNAVPESGIPTEWSQYGQGVTGSIYVSALPDQTYTLQLDTVCYPEDLVDDTTPEAIPYPWTDCVPIFAAYYALLSAQRMQDAQAKYQMYEEFTQRARSMSNPDVVPIAYSQPPQDPTIPGRLGVMPRKPQGGA